MGFTHTKLTRHRPDFILLFVVLVLVSVGLVNVYSASMIWAAENLKAASPSYFFIRQMIWAIMGTFFMLFIMNVHYRVWLRLTKFALVSTTLLLVIVLFIGQEVNGAKRWLGFGFLSLQPSEFSIFAILLYVSYLLTKKGEQITDFKKGVLPSLIIAIIPALLILKEPDMGTAVLLIGTVFCVLYCAGARFRHLFSIFIIGSAASIYFIFSSKYRAERITAFLNPWDASNSDSAFQIKNSLYAIASGGWTGQGLGHSIEKFLYLPEPHTDFIFAILIEEWGIIGAIIVIILFAILIWRGTMIATRIPDRFASIFATGITAMIGIAMIVNIGMVTDVLPVIGVPLPFISYGGSSLFIKMTAIGILLNISRYTLEERSKLRPSPPVHAVPQPIRRSRFDT
ncbi:stage V sporulation protein E [Collibacillus ludicampi]|jgi:cell division protein FtsW|uniref:Probable peptidoglycan glycosyltransferase FtsW n=1 Tax=Collibacillus ludicampi TaxID=2771369 RepID=A0AAV4LAV2_9BACL|nr:putative lipid II flippase FtsW [Collibacillus ludicampi]GIM44844.1 stage V sporulation protein E [Collibacillus ludicampi]